jgi:hypothetical protein
MSPTGRAKAFLTAMMGDRGHSRLLRRVPLERVTARWAMSGSRLHSGVDKPLRERFFSKEVMNCRELSATVAIKEMIGRSLKP